MRTEAKRTKEQITRWRRGYALVLCQAVNHSRDPARFPKLKLMPSDTERPVRIADDPEFDTVDLASAIIKVVQGEEDRNWTHYFEGAERIVRFLQNHVAHLDLGLHILEPTSDQHVPPPPNWPPASEPNSPLILRIGHDRYGMELCLGLEVLDAAGKGNSSTWLVQEYLRYEFVYKSLLKLGVCHFEVCGRLYVKARHRSTRQRYCCRACRDKDYRLARKTMVASGEPK